MGKQDTWVHRIYGGIQDIQYYQGKHKIYSGIQGIRDNILGSLYGDYLPQRLS